MRKMIAKQSVKMLIKKNKFLAITSFSNHRLLAVVSEVVLLSLT